MAHADRHVRNTRAACFSFAYRPADRAGIAADDPSDGDRAPPGRAIMPLAVCHELEGKDTDLLGRAARSVPIILATFPFVAGIPQADTIFNVVFFVVIASVFIQGTSIPLVSRILKLHVPLAGRGIIPLNLKRQKALMRN